MNFKSVKYLTTAIVMASSTTSPVIAEAVTSTTTLTNSEKATVSPVNLSSEKSLKEAMDWANSIRGMSVDFDGAYGAQCVDLTMAYSDYLFGTRNLGNATDYPYLEFPGFTRLSKEQTKPQAGDIAIWIGSNGNGHVGVVISSTGDSFTTLEQNVAGNQTVQEYSHDTGALYDLDFWGVQRPVLSDTKGEEVPKTQETPKSEVIPTTTDVVHRLYNMNNGDHYFTKNSEEARLLLSQGYEYEGKAFTDVKDGIPVYSAYNGISGAHFYTTDPIEYQERIDSGWSGEGIAWNSPKTGKDVSRFYDPISGRQLVTGSQQEISALLADGWVNEGVVFKN